MRDSWMYSVEGELYAVRGKYVTWKENFYRGRQVCSPWRWIYAIRDRYVS